MHEDLEYETNTIFKYISNNKKGTLNKLIDDVDIEKKVVIVVFNLLYKNGLIDKSKKNDLIYYETKPTLSSVEFGKGINLGIDLTFLKENIVLSEGKTIEDLTNFIVSGELEKAIEEEETKKVEEFKKEIEKQCQLQISQTMLGDHREDLKNIISRQKENKTLDENSINLLMEIENVLDKEYENLFDKLKNKKISSTIGN